MDAAQIVAQSLSTGERRVLVEGGYDARYVPTGHLIYTLDDGLFAVVFDAATLTVSGGAVPLVDEVMRGGIFTGTAHYDVADDGTLVYVRGTSVTAFSTLLWVDREGLAERIDEVADLRGVEAKDATFATGLVPVAAGLSGKFQSDSNDGSYVEFLGTINDERQLGRAFNDKDALNA